MKLTPAERAALTRDLERIMQMQDELAEAGATAVERAYGEALTAAVVRLKRLVRGLQTDAEGRVIPSIAGVTSISPALVQRGAIAEVWREWVARLSSLLKLQADYGRRVGGGAGALWLGADQSAIEALVGLWDGAGEPSVGSLAQRFVTLTLDQQAKLSQMTTRHILGRLPQADFERAVELELERDRSAARRIIHDETLTLARTAHEIKARQLGLDHYRYSGPDDAVTRPFCRRLVGRVLSRDEIDRLDNGQTGQGSVIVTCGGYNCRHRWAAVSPDYYSPDEWASLRPPADDL